MIPYGISQAFMKRCVNNVVNAVSLKIANFIKFPLLDEEIAMYKRQFYHVRVSQRCGLHGLHSHLDLCTV